MQSQWQKQKQWKVHSLLTIAGGPLAASWRRAPRILATYLSSRSRPALAVGNRSAGGGQTGFAASIFNALPGRPIGALPPAHPTPAALGALATPGVCGSPPVPEGEGMVQGGRRARGEQAPPLSPRLHTRCQKAQLPVWHSSQETGGSRRGPYCGA